MRSSTGLRADPSIPIGHGRLGANLVCWLLGLTLLGAVINDAGASQTRIAALSLARIPDAATIEIRLPVEEGDDDLGLAVTLATEFTILLTDLGHPVVERGGELIFRFAAEEPTYAQAGDGSRHTNLPPHGRHADWRNPPTGAILVPVSQTMAQNDSDTYRLRVSVARARKPPLWTGFIERPVRGAERRDAYLSMAKDVMRFWGKNHPQPN